MGAESYAEEPKVQVHPDEVLGNDSEVSLSPRSSSEGAAGPSRGRPSAALDPDFEIPAGECFFKCGSGLSRGPGFERVHSELKAGQVGLSHGLNLEKMSMLSFEEAGSSICFSAMGSARVLRAMLSFATRLLCLQGY